MIDASFNGDIAVLEQRRFFFKPDNMTDDSIWIVPLNWVTRKNPNFNNTKANTYLTENSMSIMIENASTDWVIFNVQQTG